MKENSHPMAELLIWLKEPHSASLRCVAGWAIAQEWVDEVEERGVAGTQPH